MSAQQVIEKFKALPPTERAQVVKFIIEQDWNAAARQKIDHAWEQAKSGQLHTPEQAQENLAARKEVLQSELEMILEERCQGPFAPLEPDWKERVRKAAQDRD